MTDDGDRDLDLVLLGATGFVGRLTAAHLLRSAPTGVRIALAGRSAERLTALRDDLGAGAAAWELVTVDVTDRRALDRLAARTRVLVTTVGPYARAGLPVVAACAQHGTHYADLTGETLFARDSVARSHEAARASGARIVHSCGFDSVPSDLGVRLVADQAAADGEGTPGATTLHVREMRGGLSGGTVDSLRQQLITVEGQPDLRRFLSDPDALTGGTSPGRGRRGHATLTRDEGSGVWSAPFVMSVYNRQVVMRNRRPAGRCVRTGLRLPRGRRHGPGSVGRRGGGRRGRGPRRFGRLAHQPGHPRRRRPGAPRPR